MGGLSNSVGRVHRSMERLFALETALRPIVFVATATHPGTRSAVVLDIPANPSNQAAPVHACDAARTADLLHLCAQPRPSPVPTG